MFRTALFFSLLAVVACDPSEMNIPPEEDSNVSGRILADMPIAGEVEGPVTRGYLWAIEEGLYSYDLHATQDQGWVMLGGMVDVDSLRPGETVELDPGLSATFGCSGPAEFEAEFDEAAETVFVTKEDLVVDGEVVNAEITITATFWDGSEMTVVFVPPSEDDRGGDGSEG